MLLVVYDVMNFYITMQVIMEKMSKSKHNGVDPANVVAVHGTDVTRLGVLRGESPASNRSWSEDSLIPVNKWVSRIWKTVGTFINAKQVRGYA